ncbi:hypothetical protein ACFPH6_46080 [Streptomyces xiangluensis]|uniref:MYXO-CTERM domain-containing protein n=1 Tax=Streptomyces xiangluensis TaxID=2665720 RepID=A0ABV8Z2R8_9ACTN
MRSARMLLATGAAAAVLAIGAPGAYAGDWDQQDSSSKGENSSSYGKDHGKEGKEHGKEGKDWKGKHDKHDWPKGGVHTGGGALTAVGEDDWGKDKGHGKDWKDKHDKPHGGVHTGGGALTAVGEDHWGKDKGHGKDWKDKHDKPHGGVHTGGGGLAEPSVTAGGLAVLAVAGAGLFAARRKKSVASVA